MNIKLMGTASDLHKVFIDDESYNSGHGKAYESYGINPEQGAIVVVRPDQCKLYFTVGVVSEDAYYCVADISLVISMDDHASLGAFFNGFVLDQEV